MGKLAESKTYDWFCTCLLGVIFLFVYVIGFIMLLCSIGKLLIPERVLAAFKHLLPKKPTARPV